MLPGSGTGDLGLRCAISLACKRQIGGVKTKWTGRDGYSDQCEQYNRE